MGSDLLKCGSSGCPLCLPWTPERQRPEDDVLAGELPLHQGCLRHAPHQDGRVDGERRKGHRSHHGRQSLHFRRIQERETTSTLCAKIWKGPKSRNGWHKSLKSSWLREPRTRGRMNLTSWKPSSRSMKNSFPLSPRLRLWLTCTGNAMPMVMS